MYRSSVCPRQVSRFSGSGKAMILQQVPLLPLIKLNQHSGAVFDYSFLLLLASAFLDSSRSGTATFSKEMATTSFRISDLLTRRTFLVKVKKNLVNSENNENLSNYQLWKGKPSLWSISLNFRVFLTIVHLYFAWLHSPQWFQSKFRAGNFPGRDRVRVHCAGSCIWPRLTWTLGFFKRECVVPTSPLSFCYVMLCLLYWPWNVYPCKLQRSIKELMWGDGAY